MGDMAPRPRGGWQTGSRRRQKSAEEIEQSIANDPAPDCWSVKRENGIFVVKHYLSQAAETPCCIYKVKPREGQSDVDALTRAPQCIRELKKAAKVPA
jgi:hypothetical protein